jgi:outer membrane immunogenic protein
MRRLQCALLATVAVIGFTSIASAADLPVKAPIYKAAPMVESMPWSGIYLGGQVGYAWSRGGYTVNQALGSEAFSFNPTSVIGGGHLGAQHQWGNLVLGVEGTYSGLSLDQTQLATLAGVVGSERHLKTNGIATVVAKVGYAWDQWLVYGKGGWADLNVSTHTFTPATGVNSNTSGWVGGYTLGAGIDYMLLRNVILGADFNYYRASTDRTTTFSNGAAVTFSGINENIYAVTVRASYLFGIP